MGTGRKAARRSTAALYALHNLLYCGFAFVAGWLADRFDKEQVARRQFLSRHLSSTLCVMFLPMNIWTLAFIFMLAGIFVAMEETLEDTFCAELVRRGPPRHGVWNAGDCQRPRRPDLNSLVVGLLWSAFGTGIAFAYSGVLFLLGGCLILRVARKRTT